MINKILFSFFLLAFVFGGVGLLGAQSASAQVSSFPAGCTSALGYSVTTGHPCNGTSFATTANLPGCTTALGYSITNGVPCSGASFAIQYLAGCNSIYSYSNISGAPCNGTAVASTLFVPDPTPGLPTTGAGGNAFNNMMLLLSSGIIALGGLTYLVRKYSIKS